MDCRLARASPESENDFMSDRIYALASVTSQPSMSTIRRRHVSVPKMHFYGDAGNTISNGKGDEGGIAGGRYDDHHTTRHAQYRRGYWSRRIGCRNHSRGGQRADRRCPEWHESGEFRRRPPRRHQYRRLTEL